MQKAEARLRRAGPLGDINDWMAGRWALLDGLRPGMEGPRAVLTEPESLDDVERVALAAEPDAGPLQPMDLGLRFQAAQPGDSISRLIGSSDPRAIGKFLSLNGMDGRDSTLRSGRSYIVPTRWDDATGGEAKAGHALLGADNARLAELAAERAELARQTELFDQGRNVWTGKPVEAEPQPRAPSAQASRPRRSKLDDNPTAKAVVGALGWGLGVAPSVVRGGVNTVKGAGEGAYFLYRLTDPYDRLRSLPGQSAGEQAFEAGMGLARYGRRALDDPSIVRADIGSALRDFQLQQDPFATPAADTLFGEFNRAFDVGENNGELLFDVGSTLLGGGFLRGAAGLGAVAKGATTKELAFLAANPGLAARWDEPYRGMSHHIVGRKESLPDWLGGGTAPPWFLESEFNKIRHKGMTTRDFYRNHVGVDDHYSGGKVGKAYGGTRWSAKRDLGWTRYGPLDRLNHGTSPHTKGVLGPVLLGGTTVDGIGGEDRR